MWRPSLLIYKRDGILSCMEKIPTIYIVTNRYKGTLYIGVTSNLVGRAYQHRQNLLEGFTKKYGCKKLVYYETYSTMEEAITREKQLKSGTRQRKMDLIDQFNLNWEDLYELICS